MSLGSPAISAALFIDIVEYIKAVRSGRIDDDDDVLTDDHPVVAFCADLLEQVSTARGSQPLIGFSPHTRRRLAFERRRMEREGHPKSVLRLLYALETVSPTLVSAGYSRDSDDTREFLADEFLDLLTAASDYLVEVQPETEEAYAAEGALEEVRDFLGYSEPDA